MLISSLNGARCLHRIWQVLDTPKRVGLIPATHVWVAFKQGSKTGIEGAVMRCAGRIQTEKLARRVRQRWDERYTSHANRAGCMQPVYSSIYG